MLHNSLRNTNLYLIREGELRKRGDLRDARAIPPKLYDLVQAIEPSICKKMVDTKFQDIIKLNPYTRQNLREELNDIIEEKEMLAGRIL